MNILVIGEQNIDIFWYGECKKICPEACVPIFNPLYQEQNIGMAGNVAANIQKFAPNDKVFLYSNPLYIKKTRLIDKICGQLITRIDENDAVLEKDKFNKDNFSLFLKNNNIESNLFAIVISSYNKGFLNTSDIQYISEYAYNRKIPCFLDSKFILGEWSEKIFCVKINNKEMGENLIHNKHPEHFCQNLIVTLGKDGAKLVNKDITIPGKNVEISGISGAGDCYLAALTIEYLKNYDLIDAMILANKVAAYKVTKPGIKLFGLEEVRL